MEGLSPHLFWDIDQTTLSYERHACFIITRVAMHGFWWDWKRLVKFYGKEKIKQELLQTRYLDKKTLNFFSHYFEIEKSEFRCYNTEPSIRKHWDY